jgi:Ketopantoate hydroxymethyltransferase
LENSGVFGIVLECTYSDISKKISKLLKIPTIGIGASVYCDGQVLVTDDILGLTDAKIKFVKKYVNIKKIINVAVSKFKSEVKSKKYPTKKYSY